MSDQEKQNLENEESLNNNQEQDNSTATQDEETDAAKKSTEGDNKEETATEEVTEQSVLDETIEKLAKLQDQNLRLMADFENYKKRSMREKADLLKYNGENVYKNLLPIIDDFNLAVSHLPEEKTPEQEGFVLIFEKFNSFLKQNGIKEIETTDVAFDTEFHEAITMFPTEDEDKKGKVMDCVQKGYTFHDKVIRFAKVVVAQ